MEYHEYIVFLFIAICISLTSSLKNKNRPCTPKTDGSCACVFSDGRGIDITNLSNYNFGWTNLNSTADILFHPCKDTSVGTRNQDDCFSGTSICMRVNTTNNVTEYVNLGKWTDGTFSSTNPREPISLQFKKNNRLTSVEFLCVEEKIPQPQLNVTEYSNNNYIVKLSSHESCVERLVALDENGKSSLSTGSLLIIIFLIFTLIYFGVGILTLKFLRGAEGKEMIPNFEFWADLPYLVRDGILFTLNGFQPSPSYDRI